MLTLQMMTAAVIDMKMDTKGFSMVMMAASEKRMLSTHMMIAKVFISVVSRYDADKRRVKKDPAFALGQLPSVKLRKRRFDAAPAMAGVVCHGRSRD